MTHRVDIKSNGVIEKWAIAEEGLYISLLTDHPYLEKKNAL